MPQTRKDLIALGVGAALLFTLWLGARDLWNPNEPTYGRAVVEMAERGDGSIPTVNGTVFAEKPILYYWMALSFAALLGGVNEFTLRLPSAVSGVASVLMIYLLVRPYVGRRRAIFAGALLATTFVVFWSARQVQMDLLLLATTLGTILAVTGVVDHGRSPRWSWGLAGVAAGLGFLAKGPVGVLCPALVLAPYLVWTGNLRALRSLSILVGLGTFVVVAAPWYVMLLVRGETDFLTELLFRQNFQRFTNPWDHAAPWWYYLKYFWIDMAPWALFVPLAWAQPDDENERKLHRLAWVWIAGIVIFFSLSASKRSPYILPVAPAVALLVSGLAESWVRGKLGRWRTMLAMGIQFGLAIGLVGLAWVVGTHPRLPGRGDPAIDAAVLLTCVVSLAGGMVVAGCLVSPWRKRFLTPVLLFWAITCLYLVASARLLPAANSLKSHRPMCESIRAHVSPDQPLRGFHEWRWRAGYSYYLGRSIANLESREALSDYWRGPGPVFLIVERGRLDAVREVIGDVEPIVDRAIGSNHAYLFASDPAFLHPGTRDDR